MANVYVDNAQNRKLGRVGMPRGSMPVSADGTYSPTKTYVDNSFNRRHGRVGLPHGSMVVTKENDSVNRLGRKYNDGGIGVSRIFNDSGIGASRIFNDSGIDVSHHSPDTCYSSIRSSTNLHLKTNWSTVKHDIPDRQQNTQREDLCIRYIRQQEQQQQEQQNHLRYIRQQEQQKHLEQEQQTRKLKQLRQQEQQLQKQQQLLQEQQHIQIQQSLQEQQTRQLIKVQEQQLRQLQQLQQQEQQLLEKQPLEQLQQFIQEQQLLQEQQLRQLNKIQEQQVRQLQQLRQQEQQLRQQLQQLQQQPFLEEQLLQVHQEQQLRQQQLQQEQLLQEQLLQVHQEQQLRQQQQQKQLLQEQLLQVHQEQQLRQQQQQLQQKQLLQEHQRIQEQQHIQKQQVQQLLQVQQERELQKQQYEIDCPDIWSSINYEQVYEFYSKTEIVWRSPETQVHVQTFNNFSQRDSVLVQNIGPGVNNAARIRDDDNDGETLDLYQGESDKSELLYNDSGIDTSMYGPFDSTNVTKYNPVRRRKECNVNYSSSPSYQGPRQIHKKSDVDCKIPNMHSGAISGSKQKHRKSKDKYMKHSKPLLRFPDEDIDVEILYGTHLEDNESDFDGFEYIHKISEGWFSEIHKAKWKNTVVAVKQINFQRATEQQLKDFKEEILLFRTLNHPNVVKCIASCTAKPNLCIVMEYMQTCLYNALYTKDKIKFLESGKIKIIQDIALGLSYLHNSNIAHCNIMSKNIILNDIHSQAPVAKITDFSLSMKDDKRTSSQRSTRIPRYSAPEVLRGDLLNVTYEKMADTYSYALVVFEIICEEEPFHTLDYRQLKRQVCELGLTPIKSSDIDLDSTVLRLLQECWDREPWQRPTAKQITQYTLRIDRLILPRYSRSQECLEYLLCVGFILFFISIFCVVFQ